MKRGFLVSGCQMFNLGQKSEKLPVISTLGLPVELPLAVDMVVIGESGERSECAIAFQMAGLGT